MAAAVALAEEAIGRASPNPSVGCVIVKNGRIVGRGWHEYAARDHAEVRALHQAGHLAAGATAYLTLEPCNHHGRTPPCAPRLVSSGIRRVVVACEDPNPRVNGRGIRCLRAAGVEVETGLMEDSAVRLIESFACYLTSGRPLVVSKAAMSLDGRIGTATRKDRKISCDAAQEFGQLLRLRSDAILVGSGTVLADNPKLTYRGRLPKARPLIRVVLDGRLRTPPAARVFEGAPELPVIIFCAEDADRRRRGRLEKRGAEVLPVPRREGGLSLQHVLDELGRRSILGVLVEGGSTVHWSFFAQRLVDKLYLLIAPMILGGRRSVPCVGGRGYARISRAPRLEMTGVFRLGSDLILEAYPGYSRSIVSPWRS